MMMTMVMRKKWKWNGHEKEGEEECSHSMFNHAQFICNGSLEIIISFSVSLFNTFSVPFFSQLTSIPFIRYSPSFPWFFPSFPPFLISSLPFSPLTNPFASHDTMTFMILDRMLVPRANKFTQCLHLCVKKGFSFPLLLRLSTLERREKRMFQLKWTSSWKRKEGWREDINKTCKKKAGNRWVSKIIICCCSPHFLLHLTSCDFLVTAADLPLSNEGVPHCVCVSCESKFQDFCSIIRSCANTNEGREPQREN